MDLNRSSVLLLDNWILCKKVNSKQERERETKGESYYISSEKKKVFLSVSMIFFLFSF